MLRLSPRARALLERARRPLTMFAIGAALAAPASAFIMREDAATEALGTATGTSAATSASASVAATATTGATTASASSAERSEARLTLGLAKLYSVPVGVAAEIQHAASSVGITPRLAMGLVHTESEFKRTAVSPVGAVGYTQVMPGTAKDLKPGTTRSELFDGTTNLELGFKYLKSLIDHYDGDVRLALTAYNRGPGIVDRLVKRGRDPENGYATKVLADPSTIDRAQEMAQQQEAAAGPASSDAAHHSGSDTSRRTHVSHHARRPTVRRRVRRAHPSRRHRRR